MDCIECKEHAKYKCPTCRRPYCSVTCCKKHKEVLCSPPDVLKDLNEPEEEQINYDFPTEDTVSPEKLKELEQSMEVKQCLENPHVREILELLDKSPNPDHLMHKYMQEPIFTEFVDACLRVVQTQHCNTNEG